MHTLPRRTRRFRPLIFSTNLSRYDMCECSPSQTTARRKHELDFAAPQTQELSSDWSTNNINRKTIKMISSAKLQGSQEAPSNKQHSSTQAHKKYPENRSNCSACWGQTPASDQTIQSAPSPSNFSSSAKPVARAVQLETRNLQNLPTILDCWPKQTMS